MALTPVPGERDSAYDLFRRGTQLLAALDHLTRSSTVRTRVDGPALNGALAGTGQLQLAFCVLLSAGILAS